MTPEAFFDKWCDAAGMDTPANRDLRSDVAALIAAERERIASLFEHTSRPFMGHEIIEKIRAAGDRTTEGGK